MRPPARPVALSRGIVRAGGLEPSEQQQPESVNAFRPGTRDDPRKQLRELLRYGKLVAENITIVKCHVRRQRQLNALRQLRDTIDALLASWKTC